MIALSPALWVPAAVLFAAAGWDLAKGEIPDVFPLGLVTWAVISRLVGYQEPLWVPPLLGLGLGFLLGLVFFSLGWLGGGDGKLLAGLGACLGPLGLLVALPWMALFGGVMALWAKRRGHSELVYGPAIALGYAAPSTPPVT